MIFRLIVHVDEPDLIYLPHASCLIHYMLNVLTNNSEVCPDLGGKKEKPTVHNLKFSLDANLSIDP